MSWDPTYDLDFNQIIPPSTVDEWFPASFGLPSSSPVTSSGGASSMFPGDRDRIPGPQPPTSPSSTTAEEILANIGRSPGAVFQKILGQGLGFDKNKLFREVIGPLLPVLMSGNGPMFAHQGKGGRGFMIGGGGGGSNTNQLMALVAQLLNKQQGASKDASPVASAPPPPAPQPMVLTRAQPIGAGNQDRFGSTAFRLPTTYSSCR